MRNEVRIEQQPPIDHKIHRNNKPAWPSKSYADSEAVPAFYVIACI